MSAEQTPDIAAVLGGALIDFWCSGLDAEDAEFVREADETAEAVNAHLPWLTAALAPVLAAAVREARAAELREAADTFGHWWQSDPIPSASIVCRALRDRADRITEPVSHEAATSGEEASKA